ncbi:MAG: hypothetical protein HGA44_20150 [Cellulomonadaceae bacterium]|nr:hypothetical protein [Cellulomonadaceae bacterium]
MTAGRRDPLAPVGRWRVVGGVVAFLGAVALVVALLLVVPTLLRSHDDGEAVLAVAARLSPLAVVEVECGGSQLRCWTSDEDPVLVLATGAEMLREAGATDVGDLACVRAPRPDLVDIDTCMVQGWVGSTVVQLSASPVLALGAGDEAVSSGTTVQVTASSD